MKIKKFSFSKDGIKDFFFRHVEKIFFGTACALILLFVWLGLKTPTFDATSPREMLTKTEQAEAYINDESHWNKLEKYRAADTEAAKRIAESKAVDPNSYSFRHIFGTAVFTLEPRRDPALVPVQDFETTYIRAQVAKVNEGGNAAPQEDSLRNLPENPVLMYPTDQQMESFTYRTDKIKDNKNIELLTVDAVVGMALIDHRKQMTNYSENFQYQRGYDPVRDVPEYVFIEVQRKTNDSEWQSITKHVYDVTPKYLAEPAKELGADDYILPTLALPIPPFLGMDYRQFSLLEKIPTRDVFAEQEPEKKSDDENEDEGQEEDPWGGNRDGGSADEKQEPQTESSDDESEEDIAPLRLVRFYDLQPKQVGKTYFYRLRAWVKDPNNPEAVNADIAANLQEENKKGGNIGLGGGSSADGGGGAGDSQDNKKMNKKKTPLSEFDLSKEVRDRLKSSEQEIPADLDDTRKELFRLARPTEWVEAARPVTVTAGFETFIAGSVDAPPVMQYDGGVFAASEPSINIVANSFQDDLGVFVPAETETMAGSLLNFDAVTNLLDPLTGAIREVFDSEDSRGQKQGRHFVTDAVVLDIMGGERQPFSRGKDVFYAPGECLIMDRNGRIHLRNDIKDETAYRHANFISDDNMLALEEAGRKKKKDDDERGGDGDF